MKTKLYSKGDPIKLTAIMNQNQTAYVNSWKLHYQPQRRH